MTNEQRFICGAFVGVCLGGVIVGYKSENLLLTGSAAVAGAVPYCMLRVSKVEDDNDLTK